MALLDCRCLWAGFTKLASMKTQQVSNVIPSFLHSAIFNGSKFLERQKHCAFWSTLFLWEIFFFSLEVSLTRGQESVV